MISRARMGMVAPYRSAKRLLDRVPADARNDRGPHLDPKISGANVVSAPSASRPPVCPIDSELGAAHGHVCERAWSMRVAGLELSELEASPLDQVGCVTVQVTTTRAASPERG